MDKIIDALIKAKLFSTLNTNSRKLEIGIQVENGMKTSFVSCCFNTERCDWAKACSENVSKSNLCHPSVVQP